MTDHETIMVFAERYALGRRTYAVGIVTQYISEHIDQMSEHCKKSLIDDIENQLFPGDYGDERDKKDWMRLLEKLKGEEEWQISIIHTNNYAKWWQKGSLYVRLMAACYMGQRRAKKTVVIIVKPCVWRR